MRAQAPARVYADGKRKLTIFLGDFTPGQTASYEVASAIVDWAKRKDCAFIVTSYSIPISGEMTEHDLAAVVNDSKAEERVKKANIPLADLTAVGGTAGRLLLQGREAETPVIALLIKAHKELEDYEAGLKLAEALMKIIPAAQCDLSAIRGEARRTEDALRNIQTHAKPPDVYQ
jgi:predicted ATP-grasp superfamily ATP-dependent carboligase